MQIQILTELANGQKEQLALVQNPGQPVAKHLVKAGQKITVVVDGVPMTGAQVVAQKKIKLVKVGEDLVLEAFDGSERLVELTNFYAEQNTVLTGDSWLMADGSQLQVIDIGVTASLVDISALAPTGVGPLTASIFGPAFATSAVVFGAVLTTDEKSSTPPVASAPVITLANDTGISASDHITKDGAVNVTGLAPGGVWEYSLDGGVSWIAGSGSSFNLAEDATYAAGDIQVRQYSASGTVGAVGQNMQVWQEDSRAPTQVILSVEGSTMMFEATANAGTGAVAGATDSAPQITAVGTAGAYVLTWSGQDTAGGDFSIYVQNFNASGRPIGAAVQLEATGNTTGADSIPQISAVGTAGAYVVTWKGQDAAGGDESIYVQNFNASGVPVGAAVQLEATGNTGGADINPQITTVGTAGAYVVTWIGTDAAGGDDSIYVQNFNASGAPVGAAVQLEATGNAGGLDYDPQITAVGTSGAYVVTWFGEDAVGGDYSIYVQNFNASGVPVGAKVQLEATGNAGGTDYAPQITAVGTAGAYVVTWCGVDAAGGDESIYVQNFNASGVPVGAAVQLEATGNTAGNDQAPQITAVGTAGAYVVTWMGLEPAGVDFSIYVQNFDASGVPVGAAVKLEAAANTPWGDNDPQITAVGTLGAYVVTWHGGDVADGEHSIYVQNFNASGVPVGAVVQLEATGNTTGYEYGNQITAVGTAGAYAVTWIGQEDAAGLDESIYVQNFNADGTPSTRAFAQGNEAGTAYLVNTSLSVVDEASITGAATNLWNPVTLDQAGVASSISTSGLVAGTYQLWLSDVAGNFFATPSSQTVTINGSGQVSPVALDLNGDGLISYSHINLDVNGDGALDHTAWTAAQDGVLLWDKYHDQIIHGHEQYAFAQYGGNTDLEGLAAAFDTNRDGQFNISDAQFAEFAAWQDANQNGVADAGEMKSLKDLGITSIALVSDGIAQTPIVGVHVFGHAQAELGNGAQMLVADAQFSYQSFSLNPTHALPVI